jgi:hypothetical protein
MPGAGSGHSPRQYLSPFGKIAPEDFDILVVDEINFLRTKSAKLSSLEFSGLQGISFLYNPLNIIS